MSIDADMAKVEERIDALLERLENFATVTLPEEALFAGATLTLPMLDETPFAGLARKLVESEEFRERDKTGVVYVRSVIEAIERTREAIVAGFIIPPHMLVFAASPYYVLHLVAVTIEALVRAKGELTWSQFFPRSGNS